VWGSILGAVFVFALPAALNYFSLLPQSAGSGGISVTSLNAILYGVFIIVFLLFEPLGIIGLLRRLQFVVRRFDERRKGGETTSTNATMSASADSEFEVERTSLPRQADA
jgi:branched-chain amino acid transport system permease protein